MATPQTRSTGNGRGRPTGGARVAVEDSRTEPGGEQRAGERRGSASQQAGAQAAEILAPESGLAALDPVSFSKAQTISVIPWINERLPPFLLSVYRRASKG